MQPSLKVRGEAVLFYDVTPAGDLDHKSEHGGCPVLEGVKWAANLWVRARIARV